MIRTAWHEQVLVVTIDRPERRNAVNHEALVGLRAAQVEASDGRADLTGVEDVGFAEALGEVLRGFGELEAVAVAAVDGPALGAGCQLAAACDLRVATPGSRFGIPAAKLGLAIDWWTVERLRDQLGGSIARGMLVAAQTYTGAQLAGSGFVHRLGTLDDALAWAADLTALAPLTMAAHKRGLEALGDRPVDPGFAALREQCWESSDAVEGRAAFLEKRPPEFTGH
jgi:enoyl-CoA hydratase/carnithine racemase